MTKEAKRDFVEENPYITWTPKKDDVNASGGEGGEWVEGDPLVNPTDSDYLSSMDIENYEAHKFSFSSLWGWLNAKFAGAGEKPTLSDDDATINTDSGNNFFKVTYRQLWSWIHNKIVGSAQIVADDDDYVVTIQQPEGALRRVNYENLWDYILGKITLNTNRGINVDSGKIGHINHISGQEGQTLNVFGYDDFGHVKNVSPKQLGRGINDEGDIIGHENNIIGVVGEDLRTFDYDSNGHITNSTAKTLGRGIYDDDGTIGHINALPADTESYLRTFRYDGNGHVTASQRKTLGRGISDADNEIGHSNIVEPDTTESLKTFTHDANGHITAYHDKTLGRGLNDTSGVIGHSNSITAQTSGLKAFAFDAHGHVSSATAKTLGRGLSDSSNVIGHSNSVTKSTEDKLSQIYWDEYGHIVGVNNKFTVSATFDSQAQNYILSRNGAYALWNDVKKAENNISANATVSITYTSNFRAVSASATRFADKVYWLNLEFQCYGAVGGGGEYIVVEGQNNLKIDGSVITKNIVFAGCTRENTSVVGATWNGGRLFINSIRNIAIDQNIKLSGIVVL